MILKFENIILGVQQILLVPFGIEIQEKNDFTCLTWTCPVCASHNKSVNIFSKANKETHTMFKCKHCGSATFVKKVAELVQLRKIPQP